MAEITVSKLGKSYGIEEIFSDVSFIINENEKIGIVGANGSGKSTLFNILTDNIDDYEGNVYKRSGLKIGYMHQSISLDSNKSIYEEMLEEFSYIHNIEKELDDLQKKLENYENEEDLHNTTLKYTNLLDKYVDLGGEYFEVKIESILIGMGFPKERFDDKVNTLSGGEKSRLELSKLLISNSDILLLDEPTNHLDMKTIEFLESYIKDINKTVVFMSHDRYFLDKIASKIFLLELGRLKVYNTNYSNFYKMRKKEIEVLERAYANQQKEIERQEEIIERFANLGGSLRKRGIAQSRSRQKLLDKMKLMERPEHFDDKMDLRFTPARESGKDVLRVNNISKSFGNFKLYEDISFNIYKGEKVGLIGGNGTGKTTLFKMILNKIKPDNGNIELGVSVFPEYFDQEQKNLDLEKTIIDEVWNKYPYLNHYDIRKYLAKFMFIGDDIFKIVGDLSGGEKSRITLLELMLSDANFLLMDEPNNHLDITSKEVLEDALNNYEATALMISHDRYFLNKVCNKLIEIEDGKLTIYHGNYDYYLSKKEELKEKRENNISINKTQRIKNFKQQKEIEKERRKLRNEIKSIEKRLEEIDAIVEELNQEYTKPEIFEDYQKAHEISEDIEKLENEKDKISKRWLDLNMELEEEDNEE